MQLASTSTPRSAINSVTCSYDSGYRRYQRTHKTINSPGCYRPLKGLFGVIGIVSTLPICPQQSSQRNPLRSIFRCGRSVEHSAESSLKEKRGLGRHPRGINREEAGIFDPGSLFWIQENIRLQLGLKAFFLSSITFWATAAFAGTPQRLDIPFDFAVLGETFPAGNYSVGLELQQGFITLVNDTSIAKRVFLITSPAERTEHSAVATFDVVGTNHNLRSVQIEGRISHIAGRRQTNSIISIPNR